MTAADQKELLALMDSFTDALNAHDLEGALAIVTDDFVFESTSPAPDGERIEGKARVRQVWSDMLHSTPALKFTVEEQYAMAPDRVVVRWKYDWGDGHVRGVDLMRTRGGKICESLAYVKG
jgi:ketosteroid isomerase-like protein